MGERNVVASRAALRAAGIPVVREAVGGTLGRTVRFDVRSGAVDVRSVGQDAVTL
jgi:chemotaxis protein CheD